MFFVFSPTTAHDRRSAEPKRRFECAPTFFGMADPRRSSPPGRREIVFARKTIGSVSRLAAGSIDRAYGCVPWPRGAALAAEPRVVTPIHEDDDACGYQSHSRRDRRHGDPPRSRHGPTRVRSGRDREDLRAKKGRHYGAERYGPRQISRVFAAAHPGARSFDHSPCMTPSADRNIHARAAVADSIPAWAGGVFPCPTGYSGFSFD